MSETAEKALKRSRLMYIIHSALEYFISIMVTGSFLATLTRELGFSDSLTGILSSLVSLGCLFQLFSLSIKKNKSKTICYNIQHNKPTYFYAFIRNTIVGFCQARKNSVIYHFHFISIPYLLRSQPPKNKLVNVIN